MFNDKKGNEIKEKINLKQLYEFELLQQGDIDNWEQIENEKELEEKSLKILNIFILKPKPNLDLNDNRWFPHFSKIHAFIIHAKNEEEARKLADKSSGPESNFNVRPWLDKNITTCKILKLDQDAKVLEAITI